MSGKGGFDWDMLMRFGLGALGLAPRDFWRMTPVEFDAAMKGRMGHFHEDRAMTRSRLETLSKLFPDERRGE